MSWRGSFAFGAASVPLQDERDVDVFVAIRAPSWREAVKEMGGDGSGRGADSEEAFQVLGRQVL